MRRPLAIMSVTAETIVCGNCGAPLQDALPSDDPTQRKPCASCGRTKRSYQVVIVASLTLRGGLRRKAKSPGDKRPHFEAFDGPNPSRDLGKLVHREQVIDRENDRYFERVTDYDTGKLLHECEEPLSQHSGHGTDKKNRKDDG